MKKVGLLLIPLLLGMVLIACNSNPEPPSPRPEHEKCKAPEDYELWGTEPFILKGKTNGNDITLFTVTIQQDGTALVANTNGEGGTVEADTPFFLKVVGEKNKVAYVELYVDCDGQLWINQNSFKQDKGEQS